MKNELAKHIKELKETESYYEDKVNLKYIKLKNLKDLEMSGLSIQALKKLKCILIGLCSEFKTTNIEDTKNDSPPKTTAALPIITANTVIICTIITLSF